MRIAEYSVYAVEIAHINCAAHFRLNLQTCLFKFPRGNLQPPKSLFPYLLASVCLLLFIGDNMAASHLK